MGRDDADIRRARAIRMALLLVFAAVVIYGSFIFLHYQRSRGLM